MMSFIGTPLFWVGVSVMIVIFLLTVVLMFIFFKQAQNAQHIAEDYNKKADDYEKEAEKYRTKAQKSNIEVEKNKEDADRYCYLTKFERGSAEKYEKLAKRRKICARVVSFISVCVFMMLIASYVFLNKKQSIDESYYNVALMNQSSDATTVLEVFKKYEREYKSEYDWAMETVHMDWYDDVFMDDNKNITEEHIGKYSDKVKKIFKEIPSNIDMRKNPNNLEEFNRLLEIFERAVSEPIGAKDPGELWDAFKAGREVAKIYNTSANVFQTFVLAEGAHSNAYKISRNNPNTLIYLAGATEKMEEFIKFITKDPGDGTSISVDSVSFRLGKMDYREGTREKDEHNPQARHFILKAYEEFQYAIENVNMDDENYLTYLYYCSLACLRMMSYVDDGELREKLCKQEVNRWEEYKEYVGDEFDIMKVENASDLQGMIDMLKEYYDE